MKQLKHVVHIYITCGDFCIRNI